MDENKNKLWKQAIKWPLYSVAILPVFISGAYLLNSYEKVSISNLFAFIFNSHTEITSLLNRVYKLSYIFYFSA